MLMYVSRRFLHDPRVSINIRRPRHRQCQIRKMSASCRVAVLQLSCTSDKLRNREKCHELLCKAKNFGAQAAFLPEAFDFIGESAKQTAELAEELNQEGGTVEYFQDLAVKLDMILSLGGFHEKIPNRTKLANTHVLIIPGIGIKTYSKTHLFDVEIPDRGVRLKESDYVIGGSEIGQPVDLGMAMFKLGMGICYDLRFPEFALALRRAGATILTYPSAFTVATGSAGHWFALLKARAIENQCYVIAAAQTGIHNPKRSSFGHACIIDPYGCVIAECPEGENVVVAELSMDKLKEIRTNMPVENHRRPDLYALASRDGHSVGDKCLDEKTFRFGQYSNSGKCIVFQSRLSYVLVNKKPVLPGHLLVIPKRCAKRLGDLTVDESQDLFTIVMEAQKLAESYFKSSSSTISIQDGAAAGQTVEHVHVHILPRHVGDFANNDDIYDKLQTHDKGENIQWRSEEEMAEESQLLRDHYARL